MESQLLTSSAEERVDPRIRRTRTLLREALLAHLQEKSFEAVSIADITSRATVNRATFYSHYPDKFALLEDMIRGQVRECVLGGDPLEGHAPRALLRAVGTRVFDFAARHGECKLDSGSETIFVRSIARELQSVLGAYLSEASSVVAAAALAGVAMKYRCSGKGRPSREAIEEIVDVLVGGVRA